MSRGATPLLGKINFACGRDSGRIGNLTTHETTFTLSRTSRITMVFRCCGLRASGRHAACELRFRPFPETVVLTRKIDATHENGATLSARSKAESFDNRRRLHAI
jgi:hypothetical protein